MVRFIWQHKRGQCDWIKINVHACFNLICLWFCECRWFLCMLDIKICHASNVSGLGNRLGLNPLELIMIIVMVVSYRHTSHLCSTVTSVVLLNSVTTLVKWICFKYLFLFHIVRCFAYNNKYFITFSNARQYPGLRATPVGASIWASTPNFRGLVKKTQLQ
jgi:hypothetical protein